MTEGDPYADDIRDRMHADMVATLSQQGWSVDDIEAVVDALVEDGMHQVYKAWDEGRP